ncbi:MULTISPECIES: DUF2281 domain-containing protein [Salegentibacter]|uniref:DUF2281 domain-containing protein n=1 Tax=Salegentibacter salarius TaxID=435906 RepID=A0A2N0TZD9_9FLAO|nr:MULTISPECIES: DUF2281 domain-containing protein [Salegentibacter]MBZ9630007.1 DUF2281 domain-containing protein [Salegentibacter lacus]OEY73287.1 hypothetical protein BHS39_09750 [Salegentibacter salarius]PKD20107.1 hypothetical protein APR40_09730 [Salegentibacter salarius]SLJ97858.1 Protein of unknown function [Salegentibacter salarius]
MKKQAILKKTMQDISRLPEWRIREVSDFVEFLLQKSEEKELVNDLQSNAAKSKSFHFLEEEEELYSDEDLTEKF